MGFLEGLFGGGNKKEEDKKESNPGGNYMAVPKPDSPDRLAEADFEGVDTEKEIKFLQAKIEDIKAARESGRNHPDDEQLGFYEEKLTNLIESKARNSNPL